jgi:hypothetical protein
MDNTALIFLFEEEKEMKGESKLFSCLKRKHRLPYLLVLYEKVQFVVLESTHYHYPLQKGLSLL